MSGDAILMGWLLLVQKDEEDESYGPSDSYSFAPLALTLHEALLLRLALSSLSQLSETPFKQERESLLAKVQTLLPRREREDLDQLEQTLSLDVPSRPYPTPFLDHLLESARLQQWVAATYRSERGVSQQTLLPRRVRTEGGLWYCEAYSFERGEMRVYRIDATLETIEAHGGKTVLPKREIPHVGWWAVFADPSGNHLGLFTKV